MTITCAQLRTLKIYFQINISVLQKLSDYELTLPLYFDFTQGTRDRNFQIFKNMNILYGTQL